MAEKQVVKYDVTEAAISEMRNLYMDLTVEDFEDEKGYAEVELARKAVKAKRVAVEKQRKIFKADALEYGRMVDSKAKEIFALLDPIETHLTAEGDKVRNELARIEAEKEAAEKAKIQERINALLKIGVNLEWFTVATMTDDDFNTFYSTARINFEAEQSRIEVEKERLLREAAAEQAEREKKEAELKAEAERQELVRKEQAAAQDKIDAAQKKLDAEKREAEHQKELETARKEAAEKAAKEERERTARAIETARIAAEEAETARLLQEAFEKAEAERKGALLPDKEKLLAWVDKIASVPDPELKDEKAKDVWRIAVEYIDNILRGVKSETERL